VALVLRRRLTEEASKTPSTESGSSGKPILRELQLEAAPLVCEHKDPQSLKEVRVVVECWVVPNTPLRRSPDYTGGEIGLESPLKGLQKLLWMFPALRSPSRRTRHLTQTVHQRVCCRERTSNLLYSLTPAS
jgi:hypothetical protein